MDLKVGQCVLFLVLSSGLVQASSAFVFWSALLEISYLDIQTNLTIKRYCECGVYGRNSPLEGASGRLMMPIQDPTGCVGLPIYSRNNSIPPWIALVKRGNCTFSEKIKGAQAEGAAAIVVYNVEGTRNETMHMSHPDAPGMVAIMIGNGIGLEITKLVNMGIPIEMVIDLGNPHGPWMDTYWLYFLSIAFFIVTAASIGYFVFVSAHRLVNLRMQRRSDDRLKKDAKKAIKQLVVRTVKRGDPETGLDAQTCAVCIESYKAGDVITVLTCGHIFHKACIEPWLLEKRTCPMCKCDILKALGVENVDEKNEVSNTYSYPPPDVTVITVSGGEPLYEVPLTGPQTPEPQEHQHRYVNDAFEEDAQDRRG
ncbi:E3 ubiquitin-protein ligase RNF128-like [Gadus chalcogrammus]|uniref:E3 ubiquitin-protein ligase RNF128-like n=1 Tax=Gadus chalcogrammus TaxID=1042646 RepID=UPI0024C4AF48|nr:E3 ubiquitin-protein ligase RNF128-like [Gadus chalcogrammus]